MRRLTSRQRSGMTLMEVIIAMAIFITFLVGAMEAMVSMRNLTTAHERTEDLENEGKKILRTLSNDLANSAWFYSAGFSTRTAEFPKVTKAASGVYGDTLDFVKLRTERSLSVNPQDLHVEHVNFANSASKPVRFSQYTQALPVNSLVLNNNYLDPKILSDPSTYLNDTYVAAVWESALPGLDFNQNAKSENVRVYRYEVEISPLTGLGRLQRTYRNRAGDPWQTAETLSDNVLEFEVNLFNTPGSISGLNMNQIRFRLVLERAGTDGVASSRRVIETVVAMRSITNDKTN